MRSSTRHLVRFITLSVSLCVITNVAQATDNCPAQRKLCASMQKDCTEWEVMCARAPYFKDSDLTRSICETAEEHCTASERFCAEVLLTCG